MALRLLQTLILLQALCALYSARAGTPTLFMQDHDGPVLEGQDVTLECLTNTDGDMSLYTFQKYSKWMQNWVNLDKVNTFRCWYYDVNITREDGRLLLHIPDIKPWQVGPYRCVGRAPHIQNLTADDDDSVTRNFTDDSFAAVLSRSAAFSAVAPFATSENLTIPFYYLHDVYLSRTNVWCGTVGPKLVVEEGDDVDLRCRAETDDLHEANYEWSKEGEDWIVASNMLKLKAVDMNQAGTYMCQARHPGLYDLVKSKSVQLQVVKPGQGWTNKLLRAMPSSTTGLLSMAIGIPAGVLLLVILIIALVIRRRRANTSKKVLIEAPPEQRSPIYKGSQDSLPSTAGDTQPLVK